MAQAFARRYLLVDRYYSVAKGALRRVDKNHMFFGDKINGNTDALDAIVSVTCKYTDVVNIQYYDPWEKQKALMDRWTDKVAGLEAGAHDYIVKPFHIEEVLARLWTHIRIAEGKNATDLVCGPLRLDTGSMRHILLDGTRLQLTGMEFRLLTFMMLNQGKVLSRASLMDHIYDLTADRDSNTLEVFVYKIRKKLGEHRGLLRTVAGRGYYLGEAGDED